QSSANDVVASFSRGNGRLRSQIDTPLIVLPLDPGAPGLANSAARAFARAFRPRLAGWEFITGDSGMDATVGGTITNQAINFISSHNNNRASGIISHPP